MRTCFVVSLFSVAVIVLIVGYDIYQTPPDPHFTGSATIEVSGGGHFKGEVGTVSDPRTVEGTLSRGYPLSLEVPYRRADYVAAYIRWANGSSGMTKIQVDCKTVDESSRHAVGWKAPRSEPTGRARCV